VRDNQGPCCGSTKLLWLATKIRGLPSHGCNRTDRNRRGGLNNTNLSFPASTNPLPAYDPNNHTAHVSCAFRSWLSSNLSDCLGSTSPSCPSAIGSPNLLSLTCSRTYRSRDQPLYNIFVSCWSTKNLPTSRCSFGNRCCLLEEWKMLCNRRLDGHNNASFARSSNL